MKEVIKKIFVISWACILLMLIGLTTSGAIGATGPRITPGLLSLEKLEIFAYEYPPLATIAMSGGGLYAEIVLEALNEEKVESIITILPVRSLVKYNLIQDTAIAILGQGWNFSEEQRKQLIVIPFCIITGEYVYYRSAHRQELTWEGKLDNLKGYTYGAQKGEDVTAYEKAGIGVVYGNSVSLFKKLKAREIDFLSTPNICKEWLIKKYFPGESNNFATMKIPAWEAPSAILFNKKHPEGESVAKKFMEGFEKIKQNGKYIEILEKYYGKGNIPKDYIQRLENYQKKTE
ncbi:MAG: transporter substrate-binding domain-containing protein [Deltaproteobacteria bacterium]|nr:transporter substrate-binding domain-containing protein [Deltaproteobacteria bacterium]